MGILDDVVINAKSAAEAVGKKAGQLVDVSKLRISEAEINAELCKKYQLFGQYAYEHGRELLAEDAEAAGKMAELDELITQLETVNKELNDKQNRVLCPGCGRNCSSEFTYCSNCGTKLVE